MHDVNRNRHDLRRGMTGFKASQRVGARHTEKVDYAVFKRKLLEDLKHEV